MIISKRSTGPLQNAPDKLLDAEQNTGGSTPSAIKASKGQTDVTGNAGSNVIDSGGSATTATGGGGNDTYVFDAGYGGLTVNNFDKANTGNEGVVSFGQGIKVSDLTFSRSGAAATSHYLPQTGTDLNDLVITVSDGRSTDVVTVANVFDNSGAYRIKGLSFADGTTLSLEQIVAKLNVPSATNTSLYGTSGDETLDSQGIATYEEGRGGQDTYVYHRGYGALTINNYDLGNDGTNGSIAFDASVSPADVGVALGGAAGTDLILSIQGTSDQITLKNGFDPSGKYLVGQVRFSDGTIWTPDQIAGMTEPAAHYDGTPYNDYLTATQGPGVFDGKGANSPYGYNSDYEVGSGGADVFLFNPGYGRLNIQEQRSSPSLPSTLKFGEGITPDQVRVSGDGTNIILHIGSNNDIVSLNNMQSNAGQGVGLVQFADGTKWTAAQLGSMATTSTPGDDILYGGEAGSVFDGEGGHDKAVGQSNNDTFVFNPGYGQLEIDESGYGPGDPMQNSLVFGPGIDPSQLHLSATRSGDLIIAIGAGGDQVTVDGMLQDNVTQGVQAIVFADGTTWTAQQALSRLPTTGTPGDDALYGSSAAEVFDGEGGNDYEHGRGGGDTFIFNPGYGQLEIDETDYATPANNALLLGAGITPSQVQVSGDGTNIVLTIGAAGDQVTLDGMQAQPGTSGVQSVQFADGSTWSASQVLALADIGSPGPDTLYGTAGPDTFDGKGGDDVEVGGGGGDTFIFNPGYGQLEIDENNDSYNTSTATLQLGDGITSDQVAAAADRSGDITLTDGTPGDQVKIDGMLDLGYGGYAQYGVAQVAFADGTMLSRQQIMTLAMLGTVGADVLYGTTSADTLDGRGAPAGSQDYAQGNGGADTFVFDPGYGQLEINEDAGDHNASTATLQLGAGISAAALSGAADQDGNVFLTDGVAGDQVKIDGMLNFSQDGHAEHGIAQVAFANGTMLSRQQIVNLTTTGTAVADILYGTEDADTFDGKGAPAGSQDYEQGNGGADTFVFDSGYGQLEIDEDASSYNASTATLQLGAGISAAAVSVARDQDGTVFLTDGVAGDQVKLKWMLAPYGGDAQYGVAQVSFSDGTMLSRQQIVDLTTTGTAGADALYGTAGADTFDGKGAPAGSQDYERGFGGADTFVFNPGYDQLRIDEDARYDNASTATLQFGAGISAAAVSVARDQNGGIFLTDGVVGDRVEIDGMLNLGSNGYAEYGVARIQFSDGTAWTRSQVAALVGMGTAGSDTSVGTSGNDLLDGRGGGDTISGGGGYDTYFMRQGYGALTVDNSTPGGTAAQGEVDFGPGITEQNLWFSQSGDDLVATVLGSADAVKVKGWFGGNPSAQLAELKAFDGMRLDGKLGQLVSAMAAYQGANPGYSPATAAAMPNDLSLRSAIAAAWHG